MGGVSRRRQAADDSVRHAGNAHRVALLHRQVSERSRELPCILDLGQAARAETHRAAGIEDEAAAQVGVGLELLDIEAVRPAIDAPVEPAEVIARDILSVLSELDARTAMRARMPARDAA